METRQPTLREIEELVSFLPRLYADGFTPVKSWGGGDDAEDGVVFMPFPEYDETVREFFRMVSREVWSDYDYDPGDAGRMIESENFIESADLAQIKTMLTYCARGERFCEGHWEAMIKGGYIRRLLLRLEELRSAIV